VPNLVLGGWTANHVVCLRQARDFFPLEQIITVQRYSEHLFGVESDEAPRCMVHASPEAFCQHTRKANIPGVSHFPGRFFAVLTVHFNVVPSSFFRPQGTGSSQEMPTLASRTCPLRGLKSPSGGNVKAQSMMVFSSGSPSDVSYVSQGQHRHRKQ